MMSPNSIVNSPSFPSHERNGELLFFSSPPDKWAIAIWWCLNISTMKRKNNINSWSNGKPVPLRDSKCVNASAIKTFVGKVVFFFSSLLIYEKNASHCSFWHKKHNCSLRNAQNFATPLNWLIAVIKNRSFFCNFFQGFPTELCNIRTGFASSWGGESGGKKQMRGNWSCPGAVDTSTRRYPVPIAHGIRKIGGSWTCVTGISHRRMMGMEKIFSGHYCK